MIKFSPSVNFSGKSVIKNCYDVSLLRSHQHCVGCTFGTLIIDIVFDKSYDE